MLCNFVFGACGGGCIFFIAFLGSGVIRSGMNERVLTNPQQIAVSRIVVAFSFFFLFLFFLFDVSSLVKVDEYHHIIA